jgi:hypothetical protein
MPPFRCFQGVFRWCLWGSLCSRSRNILEDALAAAAEEAAKDDKGKNKNKDKTRWQHSRGGELKLLVFTAALETPQVEAVVVSALRAFTRLDKQQQTEPGLQHLW